jgi:hypothetical protein
MEFHLFRNLNLLTINSIDDIFLIIANEYLLFSVVFIPLDDLMKAHTLTLYNSPHEPIQYIRFGNNALGDFFAIMPKTVGASF